VTLSGNCSIDPSFFLRDPLLNPLTAISLIGAQRASDEAACCCTTKQLASLTPEYEQEARVMLLCTLNMSTSTPRL
jgi:hypothetical protein